MGVMSGGDSPRIPLRPQDRILKPTTPTEAVQGQGQSIMELASSTLSSALRPRSASSASARSVSASPGSSASNDTGSGPVSDLSQAAAAHVPPQLAAGVPMLKVSSKKIKSVNVRLSPTAITWPSLKGGKVEITSIRELRLGQAPTEAYDGARWITIVYVRDKQWKVVHFIARTDDVYALWVRALQNLVSASSDKVVSGTQVASDSDPELRFIRQVWPAGTKAIDKATTASICAQLGLVVPPPIVAKYEFPLDLTTFRQLVRDVQTRPELGEIYKHLGGNLSHDRVRTFLADVQGESGIDVEAIFSRYADQGEWTAESLATYLSSADNKPLCKQDLTRPLPEYFIASSHNTYLVAEQWRGASTVEGYIRVLLAGCRCVEIDCHDGPFEPIVYHGLTITSSVPVRDVCQAVNKYAFVSSPYPVIISLEIRCSVEQQDRLTSIIKECFGQRLVTVELDHVEGTPSPEDLKGRILIKTKSMPRPTSPTVATITQSPPLLTVPPVLSSSPPTQDSTTDTSTESDSSLVRLARRLSLSSSKDTKVPQGHSRTLTELPVYTAAVKYQGFSKLVVYDFNHMFSVSERTAHRILKDGQGPDWIKHNFSHLTRVYPKGVRLTSSNFDPRPFWNAGAQLVAINYQTQDAGSLYNDALFHAGGYVLKPLALRQKTNEVAQQFRVRVRVISAQRFPPMAGLFVEATVDEETYRTRSTKAASLSPRWDESLEFTVEAKPSCLGLVFLHLAIKTSRGTIAQWTRPLSDSGRGYRYLSLDDRERSRYLFATLFARIDVESISPKGHHTKATATRSPSPKPPKSPRQSPQTVAGLLDTLRKE